MNRQQTTQKNIENVQPEPVNLKHGKLPFLIEKKAIKEWIEIIELKQPIQATNEIYYVLKILHHQKNVSQKLLKTTLPLITPVTIQLCQQLEHLFCTSTDNIDDKKRKIARLSINTLRYTVILYQNLSQSIVTNTQLALHYKNCLQISYLSLKQSALIYERPSNELWKIIGDIYQSAIDLHLLELTFKNSMPSIKHNNSITESIKSILLLSLCKPYHLNQLDILRLSDLLDQHHDKIILSDQQSPPCTHSWNYNSPQAVQSITPNTHIGFSSLFIDCHLLVDTLITENFGSIAELLTGSQSLIPRLIKAESIHKKISTSFASIINILEDYGQTEKINKTSVRVLSISDKLELQPVDSGLTKKNAGIAYTSHTHKENKPCLIAEASIKEDGDLDFTLINFALHECHIEDLILILDNQQESQLSIIRSMTLLQENHFQLIAEKICTDIDVVTLIHQQSERKALLCKIQDNITFLIVAPDKYTTGSSIQIDGQSYNLTRLYESTAYFMMYQIRLID